MKNFLLVIGIAGLVSLLNSDLSGQMNHRYIGMHYEYGASLNMRYGRVNMDKGHYIVECALPRLAASLCGWKMDTAKIEPVLQAKYFSMRGGKWFKMSDNSSLGFDLLWEFIGIATPPDSGETMNFTGRVISPLQIGIVYGQSFGDNCSFLIIPSYGYALGKTRNNDGKHHMRMSVEGYFQYKVSWWTIYAGAGYAYYPKGLAVTYPYDASFGGPMFSAGLAVETSW
ncbi:MAG: hypothetical protein ABIJ16_11360 [Bacteroidota bacterium]